MKKIVSIILFSVIILSGCSDSFLNRWPEDTLTSGSYYKSVEDIKAGVMGVYAPYQGLYNHGGVTAYIELVSDDGSLPFDVNFYNSFYKTNEFSLPDLWNGYYKIVVNANDVMAIIDAYTPKDDTEATLLKAYKGEVSFLRAFAYFNLVRLYGDVPMVIKHFESPSEAYGIGRMPVNEIYSKVIIPDLEFAFENCFKKGDTQLKGREAAVTKGAALTILGEVYLTMKNYEGAETALKKLIVDKAAGDKYALISDYSRIWLPENKFNSESIFEINYNRAAGFPSYHYRNMSSVGRNLYKVTTTSSKFVGHKNLMDEFVAYEEWTRYKVTVDSGWHATNNLITPIPLKMMPPLKGITAYDKIGCDYNFMITRYADALLMYAEALMMLNRKEEAVAYVNQVRARVAMPTITAADLNIDRMLHERRMELTFEGHRYFDIIRTSKAVEYISRELMSSNDYEDRILRTSPIPEYQLLLPIPVGEIQKDQTLTQNPGY